MAQQYLVATNIELSFGQKTLFHIDSFALHEGDRIGLVGENGTGKTTLLRILAGEIDPDSGMVERLRPISYIHQLGSDTTETLDPRIGAVFQTEDHRKGLSGGEKTRRRIAAALSQKAHILLADEPTTDLDAQGIGLLKEQLLAFKGALLMVSHDRRLLNDICTSIAELRDGKLELFPGNYQAYREERERRMDFARFEYSQYRSEQARLRKAIQGKAERASQVLKTPTRMGNSEARLHKRSSTEITEKISKERKAIESRLSHLEEKERVRDDPTIRMALGDTTPVVSRTVLELRDFTMRVGSKTLLSMAAARVPTGSVTALLGPNGCGKTSLIRRIAAGNDSRIRIAPGAKIGIFGQDHAESIDLEKTALENVRRDSVHSTSTARTVLSRLMLKEADILKPCKLLSGGERAKVSLAVLMLADINFLILDEPTNHLDIYTMEALEELLAHYSGTILLVSHDEHTVNAVATDLLLFENKKLVSFHGNLNAYRHSLSRDTSAEELSLSRSVLEMRMAALALRLSKPQKGDDPLKLNEEYFDLARKLRELH